MTARHWIQIILTIASFSFSYRARAGLDVSILEMSSISTQAYGQNSQCVHVRVLVPNTSFEKNISLIFRKDGSPEHRVVARYLGPADAGNEIWEAYANLGPGDFQVQVDTGATPGFGEAERTSWLLREGSGPVLYEKRPLLAIYTPQVSSRGAAPFHVAVKNFAYNKRVRVHYSRDNWKTTETADLAYVRVFNYGRGSVVLPNDEGFEIWSGSAELGPDVDSIVYYFTYEVAGQVFYDNNFGRNYTMEFR